MAAPAQSQAWNGISRRRVPRFRTQAPVDVTVLRSGISDTLPGRSVNLCERGLAAILAGELLPGESVTVELKLSPASEPLHVTATVKYQDKLRSGLEFSPMSPEQKAAVRDWARGATPETELSIAPHLPPKVAAKAASATTESVSPVRRGGPRGPRNGLARKVVLGMLAIIAIAAAAFWWSWNRQWEELESGLKIPKSDSVQAHTQVPTEVMQKLLVHKVDPVYPDEARKANLEGVVALDIVVSKEGSVVSMRPLNGPEVLAHAAMDALRWWKFSPYRVNGQPVTVETTMAVEFKR
jgi:TonB family protein